MRATNDNDVRHDTGRRRRTAGNYRDPVFFFF